MRKALLASFLLALGVVSAALAPPGRAAPGDILFRDDFERATLAPWTTTHATRSGILTGTQSSNSPTKSASCRAPRSESPGSADIRNRTPWPTTPSWRVSPDSRDR